MFISDIMKKLLPLVGKEYVVPTTKNKGRPGLFLEGLLGIPPTQNCLDCIDGELKLFPVKTLKNGSIVPKETIAITMLSREDLQTNDFKSSKCYKKMSRMLVVPYHREGDMIRFMSPTLLDKNDERFWSLYQQLETDYETIRSHYRNTGILQSSLGEYLQTRTKGPGHGSSSRAYYLRTSCIRIYVGNQ